MAVITDPDLLSRYSVVFGTDSQKVSLYPLSTGEQRGSTVTNAYVGTTGTIDSIAASFSGTIAEGDVVAILNGANAGHYYVDASPTTSALTLVDIDTGTAGAATTGLTVESYGAFTPSIAANVITLAAHGYATGDALVYEAGTGAITGLSDGVVYYVIWLSTSTFSLATSYANAIAGTSTPISGGTGANHDFHKRILVGAFQNGASTSEQIGGNSTNGNGNGDIVDGVTLQCAYSFSKEEWRTDSLVTDLSGSYNDDLARHGTPYESITSEQFEIGGGSHIDWNWFNGYTDKKVRTGGWAEKNTVSAANDFSRKTGIVTLGSLDTDTQVYFQQQSPTTAPTDFTFLGPVNESIQIYLDSDQNGTVDATWNRTTYLKLFARKKARTYVQSEIADIGVSTIQTIVNRFPLAHTTDAAITLNDANILGVTPYRDTFRQVTGVNGTDGAVTIGGTTFTSTLSTFRTTGLVTIGDTLRITSGTQAAYYTISGVQETVLDIQRDFENTSTGWASSESSLTFEIYSYVREADKTANTAADYTSGGGGNDGILDAGGGFGTLTDSGATFANTIVGDILWVTGGTTNTELQGLYKITTVAANNSQVTANTFDQSWPSALDAAVTYRVLTSGMYLQYKNVTEDTINTGSGATHIRYTSANANYSSSPTISIAGDTFNPSIGQGTLITISNTNPVAVDPSGTYTVFSRPLANTIVLVSTDTLVNFVENPSVNTAVVVSEGFRRTVGSSIFGFNWRLFTNSQGLAEAYQFAQHQLRQATDIDYGGGTFRGDITDLLMSFASPTGTGINLYFDDLDTNDINNTTVQDHSATNRSFPFTAAGTLVFNDNLQNDTNAKYWLYFTNDDAGDNQGRDYGTDAAIVVNDFDGNPIQNNVAAAASVAFTFDFDNNVQRGSASSATTAPVTLVAIGLQTAQFVVTTANITRTTGITISAVAALERNYLNDA